MAFDLCTKPGAMAPRTPIQGTGWRFPMEGAKGGTKQDSKNKKASKSRANPSGAAESALRMRSSGDLSKANAECAAQGSRAG